MLVSGSAVLACIAEGDNEYVFKMGSASFKTRHPETHHLMTVVDPADAVLPPTIRARTRVIVREKLPGRAPRTVILANRSPLPLGKIRSPALPVLLSNSRFLEPAVFSGLDSWHRWMTLDQKFQVIVALF